MSMLVGWGKNQEEDFTTILKINKINFLKIKIKFETKLEIENKK